MAQGQRMFVDLFAGCGGLSLGLAKSGWTGLFAIERSPDAFSTLRHNLVEQTSYNEIIGRFAWPEWLEVAPWEIREFLRVHRGSLESLKSHVDLVAGGPPCQGFSLAGRRDYDDPRNQLFKYYLEVVSILRPALVLLENVKGISVPFGRRELSDYEDSDASTDTSYALRISNELDGIGYDVEPHVVRAVQFGVPQYRPRYFIVGVRKDLIPERGKMRLQMRLDSIRVRFLEERGLPVDQSVTVADAISDMTVAANGTRPWGNRGEKSAFREIAYKGPRTAYQKLMHGAMGEESPNSLRLPNHRQDTIERFEKIHATCRKGTQLSDQDRRRLGVRKIILVPLSPDHPSHTVTTLPDDLLHYSEARIHTVRENARLQSFPDWFAFQGKYTTGGHERKSECPRYTQVGNAVPPLLAEAIGTVLMSYLGGDS